MLVFFSRLVRSASTKKRCSYWARGNAALPSRTLLQGFYIDQTILYFIFASIQLLTIEFLHLFRAKIQPI